MFRLQESPVWRASNWSCNKDIISVRLSRLHLCGSLAIQLRILARPDVACHPVNNTTKSCQELWHKPEIIIEFHVLLSRFTTDTWDLKVLALKHPQNSAGYRALRELSSKTCFIMYVYTTLFYSTIQNMQLLCKKSSCYIKLSLKDTVHQPFDQT